MSDVETKRVAVGEHVHVEMMPDETPLGRPVRFKYGTTGWYLTIDQAEELGNELLAAARKAREIQGVYDIVTGKKPSE